MKNLDSTQFKKILIGLITVAIALGIFQAGIFVGYHKAGYSYRMGDNYHEIFGSQHKLPGLGMPTQDFVGGNGAIGKIVGINLPTITIEDMSGVEKIITIEASTAVRKMRETLVPGSLAIGDHLVVFGKPASDNTITATLIRVLPVPPKGTELPPPPPVEPNVNVIR